MDDPLDDDLHVSILRTSAPYITWLNNTYGRHWAWLIVFEEFTFVLIIPMKKRNQASNKILILSYMMELAKAHPRGYDCMLIAYQLSVCQ